ncbi:iron/zinc/copper transport system substrate-binding protein [Virgibacillus halotolerans]|uniref:metal ABC transporter solute-binding protein, Zn/Mn family n=1 Tax=Virgibacillus halotolerans TaxID=1071053 RepID=UPI001960CF84|nr:zinc ABC transporter substrate-binding protein [Virgibacillus halotolerans]MBM7600613.1 iron/zinc/copper transport system substrate-binding protein [Virgibacillus halotolerans]
MRNIFKLAVIALMAVIVLAACGGDDTSGKGKEDSGAAGDKLQVVTSFSILNDMVKEIGGEHVDVHNLVPIGTDPHEYEPLPEDIKKATDADALFYNGLNLEGGKHGWFFKLIDSVEQDEDNIFETAKGVEPMYLTSDDGKEEEINPHAFLDPVVGIQMAENVRDALMEVDPDNKQEYEDSAEAYLDQLKEIDETYKEKIGEIPEEHRILVTSERAYQYLADRYGLEEGYIWAIDTEENGTPEQITSLVKFIDEHDVPALFVETNVDTRPMETVSKETGVDIAGEIYSDEIGKPGSPGDTYIKYLEYNIKEIHDVLAE